MSFSIAIVDSEKCKPNKCGLECKKNCPVVRIGKTCIAVKRTDKFAQIEESLCIGSTCNICTKKCPFSAINIINLPKELKENMVHRYGDNGFALYKLPIPNKNGIIGLVGDNGCGKSTILKILSNKMKPNNIDNININASLKKYFEEIEKYDSKLSSFKPQHIDKIPTTVKGLVSHCFEKALINLDKHRCTYELLGIEQIINKNIENLSGGELQRFATFYAMCKDSEIYIFDESSSFLDIKQRINLAKAIRSLDSNNKYIFVVDHDLAILDYMCDYIYLLYGKTSQYGIVSQMMTTAEGINTFLDGYITSENMRFREFPLSFKTNREDIILEKTENKSYRYPNMVKNFGDFKINIDAGSFNNNEIIVLLGENGIGKTTFIKLLAGKLNPDNDIHVPELVVSYKPQIIHPKFDGTVRDLLFSKINDAMINSQFNLEIVKPLGIHNIFDKYVKELSGGELQCVAIVLCLGRPADVYLLDECSAFLDCNKRVVVAKIIRSYIMNTKKACFVVEHDLLMILYLADKIMLFDGIPGKESNVSSPCGVVSGLNQFLKNIDVSMRKDIKSGRPRFNKLDSVMDQDQKKIGQYIFLD